jgi:hypothetical protein
MIAQFLLGSWASIMRRRDQRPGGRACVTEFGTRRVENGDSP